MSRPRPSTPHRRKRHFGERLAELLDMLDAADLRAGRRPSFTGEARRGLIEAEAMLNGSPLPPATPRNKSRKTAPSGLSFVPKSPRKRLPRKTNSRQRRKVTHVPPGPV